MPPELALAGGISLTTTACFPYSRAANLAQFFAGTAADRRPIPLEGRRILIIVQRLWGRFFYGKRWIFSRKARNNTNRRTVDPSAMSVFRACNCTINHLSRIERQAWMRLLPWLRLYQCSNCHKFQLLPEEAVNKAKAEFATRASTPYRRNRSTT
jgi:hypothetical protein